MRPTRVLATVAGCTVLAACGAQAEAEAEGSGPVTGRSLAAGLVEHVAPGAAVDPGGATYDGGAWAGVAVEGGGLESALVFVDQPVPGVDAGCDTDSGYDVVWCRGRDEITALLVRRNDNDRQPVIMARHMGGDRGDVLVQVWGSDGAAARALATSVVQDPEVGLTTSGDQLRAGQELTDWQREQLEVKVEVAEVPALPVVPAH